MEYQAVGNRCAVCLDSLQLPISNGDALSILSQKGFSVVEVDVVELARGCLGKSRYRRAARLSDAPAIVDCSSFVKWLYGQRGIWLPRRSIQQREHGETVDIEELVAGDAVFVSGWRNYHHNNPADGVGHVGIATGDGTIVHAEDSKTNVVETPLEQFVAEGRFRGARRYIPKGMQVLTFETPPEREVEIADDIRWIVFQTLPYGR